MKGFKFRYERILKQREDAEEDIKTKLGKVNHLLQSLLTEKANVLAQQTHLFDSIQERLSGGIRTADLRMFEQSKHHFKSKIEALESEIVDAQLKIIQVKKELTEAVKQRKIMEKLKEKEFEAYNEALNAAENKVIEEIVNYKSSQKSGDS